MVSYLPNLNCFILRLDCTSLELLWMKKTWNFCVLLISRVRHLDSGIQVKGYFAAGLTRYPNSVLTFNIWKLIKCGDIDINPGPYQACSTSCKNRGWKFPCDVCTNPVCINQGIFCDGCTARKIAFTMHQMSGPRFCKGHLYTNLITFDPDQRPFLLTCERLWIAYQRCSFDTPLLAVKSGSKL